MKVAKTKTKVSIKEPMNTKEKPYVRGYSPVRRILERGSKFTRSCYNCDYYYQAPGDDEEVCQNEEVLRYDMIVTEAGVCCGQWRLCARKTDAKTLFRKGK